VGGSSRDKPSGRLEIGIDQLPLDASLGSTRHLRCALL